MTIELERTLVKSPPEVWEELASEPGLGRWLDEVEVRGSSTHRTASNGPVRGRARHDRAGAAPAGALVYARQAETSTPGFLDRFRVSDVAEVERRLEQLLDHLGASTLTSS